MSQVWIYGLMLALDTGFDQRALIWRDLHRSNSIKLPHPCTDVSAALEPFVKDSKIGKSFALVKFSLRLNVNAKTEDRSFLDSSKASENVF